MRFCLLIVMISFPCAAGDPEGLSKRAAAMRLSPELIAGRMHWSGVAAFAPPRAGTNRGQATDNAASRNRRSKPLMILGTALIGTGVALMMKGPTETSRAAYTTSYNTKYVGGALAGGGALFLWQGLRRVH